MTKPAFIQAIDQALICAVAAAKGLPEDNIGVEGTIPFISGQLDYLASTYGDVDDADYISALIHISLDAGFRAQELSDNMGAGDTTGMARMVSLLKCSALVSTAAAELALAR